MKRFHFGSVVAAGAVTAGAMLTLTAPAAQAHTPLAAAHDFCDVIGGCFTTEVFGGQTHSTCTLGDGAHHFYYSNGEFRSAD
jgi:hypothetical protein